MRDRDQPSSLDDASLDARFPIWYVALFCDRGCGAEVEADVRGGTDEQAYEGLRHIALSECGWRITDTEDICSRCANATELEYAAGRLTASMTALQQDPRSCHPTPYRPAHEGIEHVIPDPIPFLRARLNEDEQAVQATTAGPWRWENEEFDGEPCLHTSEFTDHGPDLQGTGLDVKGNPIIVIGSFGYDANGLLIKRPDAMHIVRWDPARVLAEVVAKRRIIDECENWPEIIAPLRNILRIMTQVYTSHPDYDPAWAQG